MSILLNRKREVMRIHTTHPNVLASNIPRALPHNHQREHAAAFVYLRLHHPLVLMPPWTITTPRTLHDPLCSIKSVRFPWGPYMAALPQALRQIFRKPHAHENLPPPAASQTSFPQPSCPIASCQMWSVLSIGVRR